ncbi:Myb-like DNA-binding domain containing protein [Tritrichomonas foetus]|uniref:Myb-like DNA-binding domain containing protein n=1 Tax=Tritrichomonas foetus TaxID=1144522 RepID=A0A1J4K601_9EUKA|nr:Myb-like DNA-binding domain containing protein [Tritrichomonas foetus]|eukprot:OHT06304.1 Myb-like DNA-binding domain containing protein [Tritrichomonas foetus]
MKQNRAPNTRTVKENVRRIGPSKWTPTEDQILLEVIKAQQKSECRSWTKVSRLLPNKTPSEISHRWKKVLNPKLIKGSWTEEEDERIRKWVKKNGEKHWEKLAVTFFKSVRSGKQLRERWLNVLAPKNTSQWTESEDDRILSLFGEFGGKWKKISSLMKNRTENQVKNRFYALKKQIERVGRGLDPIQKRGRKAKISKTEQNLKLRSKNDTKSSGLSEKNGELMEFLDDIVNINTLNLQTNSEFVDNDNFELLNINNNMITTGIDKANNFFNYKSNMENFENIVNLNTNFNYCGNDIDSVHTEIDFPHDIQENSLISGIKEKIGNERSPIIEMIPDKEISNLILKYQSGKWEDPESMKELDRILMKF